MRKINNIGFTLIELMVVVTVMGILIFGGVAAYNEFNRKQLLRQGAESLVATLNLAKKNADRSELPSGTCGSLEGYVVRPVASSGQIDIAALCDNGAASPVDQDTKSVFLSGEIVYVSGSDFVFRTLSRGVTRPDLTVFGSYPVTITMALVENPARTIVIEIGQGGAINVP